MKATMRDNDQADTIESGDYIIDESLLRITNNRLLNDEGTGPNPALTQSSEQALAAIAAAVHKDARHLTPDHAEIAVKWLKKWKLRNALPADYGNVQARDAFDEKLRTLRESPDQVRMQAAAAWHGTWARVWAAVFAAILATIVGMSLIGGAGTIAWVVAVVALAGSLIASECSLVRALVAAKQQDRRYLFQSIHTASNVTELLNSGFFAQVPGVHYSGIVNEKLNARLTYAERERFADALYLDPDGCLDPYSFRDNGPRAA